MGLRPGSGVGPFSPLTHCIPSSPLPGTPTPLLNCTAPLSHHLSNESLPPVYRLASLSDALKKKVLFTLTLTQTMTTSLASPFSSRTGQQLSLSLPSLGCRLPPTGFSSPPGSRLTSLVARPKDQFSASLSGAFLAFQGVLHSIPAQTCLLPY